MFFKETIIYKFLQIIFRFLISIKNSLIEIFNLFIYFLITFWIGFLLPIFYFFIKKNTTKKRSKKNNLKFNVILLYSKYTSFGDKKSRRFLSFENYSLLNTLKKIEYANIFTYFFDSNLAQIPIIGDFYFIYICKKNNINFILLSGYNQYSISAPNKFTLKFISENLKIKIITFWWDSVGENFYKASKELISLSYKNIYGDTSLVREFYRSPVLDLNLGTAINTDLISIRDINNRDIDIIFLGSWDSYRKNRKDFLDKLDFLKEFGYKIYLGGGNGKRRLTFEEYFSLLGRSKICINFSEAPGGRHQVKGRVFEALASKCLLLESENSQTCSFFEINKEFVSFSNPDEMIRKINFYLQNQEYLVEIAERGNKKFCDNFNYYSYWKKIFDF